VSEIPFTRDDAVAIAELRAEVAHLSGEVARLSTAVGQLTATLATRELRDANRVGFLRGVRWTVVAIWIAIGGLAVELLKWVARKLGAG
jgi:hypothetical protein